MKKRTPIVFEQEQFDYALLETNVGKQVQESAECIRGLAQKAFRDIVAIGKHLQLVKKVLPHGQFSPWLRREFGWTNRTAQRFMAVAEHFGKNDIMSFLPIDPTAAYLLSGPKVPDEARKEAIALGQLGVRVTPTVASEILASYEECNASDDGTFDPSDALLLSVANAVERAGKRWPRNRIDELVEFLDRLTRELRRNSK